MTILPPQSLASSQHALADPVFKRLSDFLYRESGIVLSDSKKGLMIARLSRRLRELGLADFKEYETFLHGPNGQSERDFMIRLLTTNVTRFFREPHHFDFLRQEILPGLFANARARKPVRIWSAGCSSGEEVYSLAITILEQLPKAADLDIKIFGSDINEDMVTTARKGEYNIRSGTELSRDHLSRYFRTDPLVKGRITANDQVKKLVDFDILNLNKPWRLAPMFDVIFCRNVVIYFDAPTQNRLWHRFAEQMRPGGHLFIGHSERISPEAHEIFKPAGTTHYTLR